MQRYNGVALDGQEMKVRRVEQQCEWLAPNRGVTLNTRALFFPTVVIICALLPFHYARLSSFPSVWLMGTAAAAASSRAASGAILILSCHLPLPCPDIESVSYFGSCPSPQDHGRARVKPGQAGYPRAADGDGQRPWTGHHQEPRRGCRRHHAGVDLSWLCTDMHGAATFLPCACLAEWHL